MSTVGNYMILAEDCLNEARLLYNNKFYRGAGGRAYYAYFNAVRALLMSKGITTNSHRAVRGLFSNYFVKNGPFINQDSLAINELFELRQAGEYEPDEDLSATDALSSIETASEFLLQAEAYLHENGFAA